MHFKKAIFKKINSRQFILAFLIIFLSFIPRISSTDLCDVSDEAAALRAYSRAEWAVIYKLDELGIQLTDEMSEGLSKAITKLDLEPPPHEILSRGIDNLMEAPAKLGGGEEGVRRFFKAIDKVPDDVQGLDRVIKETSYSMQKSKHALSQLTFATEVVPQKYPKQRVVAFEYELPNGKRPDIRLSNGDLIDTKNIDWDRYYKNDFRIKFEFKEIAKQVEGIYAQRGDGVVRYVFEQKMDPDMKEYFIGVLEKCIPSEILEDSDNFKIFFGNYASEAVKFEF